MCGKSISDYEIVISEDADAISRYAATLISTRIGHVSGIKVDVVQENHVTGKAQIHLLSSATGLSDNEYLFRQTGDGVELAATKRTLLYAVREMTECLTDGAESQSNDITPKFAEKKKMIPRRRMQCCGSGHRMQKTGLRDLGS